MSRHDAAAKWSCVACTFANHGNMNVCEMCGTPKPLPKNPSGRPASKTLSAGAPAPASASSSRRSRTITSPLGKEEKKEKAKKEKKEKKEKSNKDTTSKSDKKEKKKESKKEKKSTKDKKTERRGESLPAGITSKALAGEESSETEDDEDVEDSFDAYLPSSLDDSSTKKNSLSSRKKRIGSLKIKKRESTSLGGLFSKKRRGRSISSGKNKQEPMTKSVPDLRQVTPTEGLDDAAGCVSMPASPALGSSDTDEGEHSRSFSSPHASPLSSNREGSLDLVSWQDKLDGAKRAIHFIIDNQTNEMLKRKGEPKVSSGNWAKVPPHVVCGRDTQEFGAYTNKSMKGSCSFGAEGSDVPIQFLWSMQKHGPVEVELVSYPKDKFVVFPQKSRSGSATASSGKEVVRLIVREKNGFADGGQDLNGDPFSSSNLMNGGLDESGDSGAAGIDDSDLDAFLAQMTSAVASPKTPEREDSSNNASQDFSFFEEKEEDAASISHTTNSDSDDDNDDSTDTGPKLMVVIAASPTPGNDRSTSTSDHGESDYKEDKASIGGGMHLSAPPPAASTSKRRRASMRGRPSTLIPRKEDAEPAVDKEQRTPQSGGEANGGDAAPEENEILGTEKDDKQDKEEQGASNEAVKQQQQQQQQPQQPQQQPQHDARTNDNEGPEGETSPANGLAKQSPKEKQQNGNDTKVNNDDHDKQKLIQPDDEPKLVDLQNEQSEATTVPFDLQSAVKQASEHMGLCASELERGRFREALPHAESGIQLLARAPDASSVQMQLKLCVQYKLALHILTQVSELEAKLKTPDHQSADDIRARLAILTRHLSMLKLGGKHAAVCIRMAIAKNMEAGNYGVASKLLKFLLEKTPPDSDKLQLRLNLCKEKGGANVTPFVAEKIYCFKECKPLTDEEQQALLCTFCKSTYSLTSQGVGNGVKCWLCTVGKLVVKKRNTE